MPGTNNEESNLVTLHGQILQYIESLNSQNFKIIAIYSPIITLASAVIALLTYTDLNFEKILMNFIIATLICMIIVISFVGSVSVFNNWQSVLSYRQMLSRISQQIDLLSSRKIDLPDVDWFFSKPRTPKEYFKYMRRIVRFYIAAAYSILNIFSFVFLGIYVNHIALCSSIGVVISLTIFYLSWIRHAFPYKNLKRKIRLQRFFLNKYQNWEENNIQPYYYRSITKMLNFKQNPDNQRLKNEYMTIIKEYVFNRKLLRKRSEIEILNTITKMGTKRQIRKKTRKVLRKNIKELRKKSEKNTRQKIKEYRVQSKQNKRHKLREFKRTKKKDLKVQFIDFFNTSKKIIFDDKYD